MAVLTPTGNELQTLAASHLAEAQALFDAGFFSGSWYLAGYAVECALKAVVCRTLNLVEYPDKVFKGNLKSHDFRDLGYFVRPESGTCKKAGGCSVQGQLGRCVNVGPSGPIPPEQNEATGRRNTGGAYRPAERSVRMALKSVVTDKFFESMMHALDALQLDKGELSFAMLSTSPYDPSRWKLTLASEWIDAMSPLRATAVVREFIKPRLTYKAEKFDGVIIRDTQDRLVRSFTSTIDIPELGTAYQVTGPELEVFHLDEAVCLLARPTVPHLQARSA